MQFLRKKEEEKLEEILTKEMVYSYGERERERERERKKERERETEKK